MTALSWHADSPGVSAGLLVWEAFPRFGAGGPWPGRGSRAQGAQVTQVQAGPAAGPGPREAGRGRAPAAGSGGGGGGSARMNEYG
jgi:hypothetical protein